MAQRGDDPPGEHELVAAGEGRHEVAGDEQDQQPQQGVLAVHPPEAGGEDDATDGHGERVSGDEVAGDGLGDSEVGGDLREKAHDDELGQSDAEAPEGEREERDGHDDSLGMRGWYERVCNHRRLQ